MDTARDRPGKLQGQTIAVVGLLAPGPEILLVRTHKLPGFWQPIGGTIEPGDGAPTETLLRETCEEVGLDLSDLEVRLELTTSWDLGIGQVFCYSAKVPKLLDLQLDENEILEAKWFGLVAASDLAALPATKKFLEHLRAEAATEGGTSAGGSDESYPAEMQIQARSGPLTDRELAVLCMSGKIITGGFDPERLRGASYELRASDIYYDLSRNKERLEVADDSYILLKPYGRYVLITEERLEVPLNMMCHVVSKGSLFSVGLLPVSTWVDPGFSGRLGIVFFNSSHNYLSIHPRRPIAKIEFTRLANPVHHAYEGQHGFGSGIWPISDDLILAEAQVDADPRIKDRLLEAAASFGPDIAQLVNRVVKFERYLIATVLAYMLLTLVLLAFSLEGRQLNILAAVGLGIFANVLTAGITLGATSFSRRNK